MTDEVDIQPDPIPEEDDEATPPIVEDDPNEPQEDPE